MTPTQDPSTDPRGVGKDRIGDDTSRGIDDAAQVNLREADALQQRIRDAEAATRERLQALEDEGTDAPADRDPAEANDEDIPKIFGLDITDLVGGLLRDYRTGIAPDAIYDVAIDTAVSAFKTCVKGMGAKVHQAVFIVIAPGTMPGAPTRLFVTGYPDVETGAAKALAMASADLNKHLREKADALREAADNNEDLKPGEFAGERTMP